MAQINDDYLKLPGSYLFADIAHKVNAFKENHPEMELIRLGIGDVTRPLPPSVIKALHKAVDEQATAEGFRGYGPEQGYRFLARRPSRKGISRLVAWRSIPMTFSSATGRSVISAIFRNCSGAGMSSP